MGWLRNAPVNPMLEWRSGLPVDGGFQSHTEYEIGARRMFEKGQSILQALGEGFGGGEDRWEKMLERKKSYIFEKLEQLIRLRREYAGPVYIRRFIDVSDYKPQYKQQAAESNLESIESIEKNAASVLLKIDEKLPALAADDSMPPSVKEAAISVYVMFAAVCRALLDSVEDWPDSISNAYATPEVVDAVDDVKSAITKMYREDYFWL
jgi:hypothetical protein